MDEKVVDSATTSQMKRSRRSRASDTHINQFLQARGGNGNG